MGITISTLNCPEEIKEKLFTINSGENDFIIYENKSENYTLFNINSKKSGYVKNLKKVLASIIAEVVLDSLEIKIVNKIINHDYQEYNLQARLKIEKFTREYLDNRDKATPRLEIISQVLQYLDQYRNLNVEGFVRFRLKDYVNQLKIAVEKAVDDYLIEKEYEEFIKLLRYFINLQDPRVPLVNIIKMEDNSFQILNEEAQVITSEYMDGYIAELLDEEVEYEDLLISALINISPERIILHFEDDEISETVKSIFQEKVEVCKGCELCQSRIDT